MAISGLFLARRVPAGISDRAEKPMPKAAAKARQLFHATVQVTRLEEWCVEAESPEQARALLEAGAGHRCTAGECVQFEVAQLIE
jgi:hypothetical protein